MKLLAELEEKLSDLNEDELQIVDRLLTDIDSGQYPKTDIKERLLTNIREMMIARSDYDIKED